MRKVRMMYLLKESLHHSDWTICVLVRALFRAKFAVHACRASRWMGRDHFGRKGYGPWLWEAEKFGVNMINEPNGKVQGLFSYVVEFRRLRVSFYNLKSFTCCVDKLWAFEEALHFTFLVKIGCRFKWEGLACLEMVLSRRRHSLDRLCKIISEKIEVRISWQRSEPLPEPHYTANLAQKTHVAKLYLFSYHWICVREIIGCGLSVKCKGWRDRSNLAFSGRVLHFWAGRGKTLLR